MQTSRCVSRAGTAVAVAFVVLTGVLLAAPPAGAATVANPCTLTIDGLGGTGGTGSVTFVATYDPTTGLVTASDIVKTDLPPISGDYQMAASQFGPRLSIGPASSGTAPAITWDESFANAPSSDDRLATFSVGGSDGSFFGALPPMYPDSCQVTEAGTSFHPLSPTRVLDSRTTTGGWDGQLVAGSPRTLLVSGATTAVPADAAAVVMNVTVTGGDANSFLTVYPAGAPVPTVSNINAAAGATVPNLVTVKVGAGGMVAFANAAGATDVVADLVGYYRGDAGDRFTSIDPTRVLDSRGATGGWGGRLVPGTPRSLTLAGTPAVPASATAVVLNVTATDADRNGFVTVFPTGEAVPPTSNLNFAAGQTVPNLVTARLGTGGQLSFAATNASLDVVADLVGFYDPSTGAYFHPLDPVRLLDSRQAASPWDQPLPSSPPGVARDLRVGGEAGVPHLARAVVGTTTVTEPTQNSYLTVFSPRPFNTPPPMTSNLNFGAGETVANSTVVALGSTAAFAGGTGTIGIRFTNAAGSTQVVFDLVGYFATT